MCFMSISGRVYSIKEIIAAHQDGRQRAPSPERLLSAGGSNQTLFLFFYFFFFFFAFIFFLLKVLKVRSTRSWSSCPYSFIFDGINFDYSLENVRIYHCD